MTWSPTLVAAAFAIAIGAAYAALWLAHRLRNEVGARWPRVLGAIVMGLAISGMHYTAMAAMRFTPLARPLAVSEDDVLATGGLAIAVTVSTLLILAIALASSVAQRELERQTGLAREHVRRFHDAERRAGEQAALRRMTEELSSAFTREDVLERITRAAVETTGADGGFVEVTSADGTEVTVAAPESELAPAPDARAPFAGSFAERVASAADALVAVFPQTSGSAARLGIPEGAHSALAVPLLENSTPVGAIVLLRGARQPPFEPEDATRAATFTHLASLALRRVHLLQEAERRREALEHAERLAALGRVASTIAHEFNNVLMAIQAFHEATRRGGTYEHFQRTAPQVERAIRRGKTVTEAVLRLTRAAQPTLRPVDFEAWLQTVAADLTALLPESIRIEVACEPGLSVLADPNHLEQVFANLALNAREAMPEGGRFSVTAVREVDATGEAVARIAVRDTGTGMTKETRRRVFEPLYTTRVGGRAWDSRSSTRSFAPTADRLRWKARRPPDPSSTSRCASRPAPPRRTRARAGARRESASFCSSKTTTQWPKA